MARSSSAKNGKSSKNTYRASGSKSSKSSSSGTRHNSSASGSKKRMSRLEQRRAQQQNLIRSVVLAGFGILAIALVLVPGQSFWNVLRSWLFGTFGVVTYFVGPFLLYLAYLLASGYHVGTFIGKVLLLAVLFIPGRHTVTDQCHVCLIPHLIRSPIPHTMRSTRSALFASSHSSLPVSSRYSRSSCSIGTIPLPISSLMMMQSGCSKRSCPVSALTSAPSLSSLFTHR